MNQVWATYYAPSFDIRIAGQSLAANMSDQVISVTYDNDLDMADMFSIELSNADNALLDSTLFDAGNTVEIHMGYGNDLQAMMLGEITSLEPSFPESGVPTLHISGYDKSYKLRTNLPDRLPYKNVSDSTIAEQIADEAHLKKQITASTIFHRQPLHQSSSDMAFLKERAQANHFEVYVLWDTLYFQPPSPQGAPFVLEWGRNLSSFTPRISSAGLTDTQVVRSYNEELAQTIVAVARTGDLNIDDLQKKLGKAAPDLLRSLGRQVMRKEKIESSNDAKTVANSLAQELLDGVYEGSGRCIGIPDLRAGKYVSIQGIGQRFSGVYRLRKVTHTMSEGGYYTDFEVTQKSGTSLLPMLRKSLQDTPPPHKPERFYGVAVAIVSKNADTEESVSLGRVKVTYPWLSDNVESGWARTVTPMAGTQTGMFFLPEVGDEVLVSFEHGNLSHPVILGSLWNKDRQPPITNSDGKDNLRLIKTKSGHTITFDDTQGSENIVITDKGGSKITMNADGTMQISAKNELTLESQNGNITLKATTVNVE